MSFKELPEVDVVGLVDAVQQQVDGVQQQIPGAATPTVSGTVRGITATDGTTALGHQAQGSNVGQRNTAVGYQTLANVTTSTNDLVAIGYRALQNITVGASDTVAIGSGAIGNASGRIPSNSVAVGTNANYNGSSSSVAIGANALATASEGSQNTAIGQGALILATGSANTAIGQNCGANITSGNSNIVIGQGATTSSGTVSNTATIGGSWITTLRCAVTTITAISDERDKTDIQDLQYGLDLINDLRPVQFEWNMRDGGKVGQKDIGFIAQELAEVEDVLEAHDVLALTYRDNPEKLEASYGRLVPVLVKAIQELSARVAELEAR